VLRAVAQASKHDERAQDHEQDADHQLGLHDRFFRSCDFSALLFFDKSARCARL
jgi:hypothetical protein